MTRDILELVQLYGRYGYRRITALLQEKGWKINRKRVMRIWKMLGLKVPKKQRKRARLWDQEHSCIRLRPEHKDHVWSFDFMIDRTYNGRPFRIFNVIDEFTRECLAIKVGRKLNSQDVMTTLAELFINRGVPKHVRCDNGSEFIATEVRYWFKKLDLQALFITPGSPWENGYIESFNGKLRDELLNGETFYSLKEAEVMLERFRKHYNTRRPHSALNYRPPAPETFVAHRTLVANNLVAL